MTREELLNRLSSIDSRIRKAESTTTVDTTGLEGFIKDLTATLERLEAEHINREMHRIVSIDKHGRELI